MTAPARPVELQLEVAQLSDPGRDPNKQVNEDSCGYAHTRLGHLAVLCDGMGGHYGGQEASRRAITTIFEEIERSPGASAAQALKAAVEMAGRKVYELGGPPDNKVRPGSTVVAMLLHDGGVDVAHVGDSRAYVIRSGQIYPLTRDHSMVQAMIDAGYITEEQGIGHPDANKITRALGMKPEVEVEVRPEPMELFPGDMLLTASDGLTDLALPKDILAAMRQSLSSGGLDHAAAQLVRMANDRGGHDNITVQIVRVVATAKQRTHSGATAHGGPSQTVPERAMQPTGPMLAGAFGAAQQAQYAPQQPHAAPYGQTPHPGGYGHAAPAPTAVDTVPEAMRAHGTHPMAPVPTAHDGTGRAYAGLTPPPAGVQPTMVQGQHLGHSPTQHSPNPGLAGYHMEGPGGLPRPPAAGGMHAPGMQGGMQGGFPHTPPMHGGDAGGMWASPPGASPYGSAAPQSGDAPSRGSGVLYLVLGASFGVAIVIMLLVWAFWLRS